MIRKHFTFFLLIIILFTACSAQKKTVDARLPDWVKSTIHNPDYYWGVGYAAKTKNSTDYYPLAMKSALSNLASGISVEIASSTMLLSLQVDKSVQDDFSSIIEARVKTDLEGCEKVDEYENKKGYWVLYRLSKQQYFLHQQEKKRLAVQQAASYFDLAVKAQSELDLKMAIIRYAKSLDAVKAYFNEVIEISDNGKVLNIIPEAHNRIYYLLNNMQLEPKNQHLSCKMGAVLSSQNLACQLLFQNNPVKNFPIQITYSHGAKNFYKSTDFNGQVLMDLAVTSDSSSEQVTFSLDKNNLLLQSAVDYAVRKWLMQVPTRSAVTVLSIKKPTIFIRSSEKNLGVELPYNRLKAVFEQRFEVESYELSKNSEKADYQLLILSDTKSQSQINGMFTSFLNAKIELRNRNGELVYSDVLNSVKGVHLNYTTAGENAYAEMIRQIDVRIFREIKESILKQKRE